MSQSEDTKNWRCLENKIIWTQEGIQPCPKRKTTMPKKEDKFFQKGRQHFPKHKITLFTGKTLLVCSLCDICVIHICGGDKELLLSFEKFISFENVCHIYPCMSNKKVR